MRLRTSFLLQEGRMPVPWKSSGARMWLSSRSGARSTFTHCVCLIPRRLTSWSTLFPQVFFSSLKLHCSDELSVIATKKLWATRILASYGFTLKNAEFCSIIVVCSGFAWLVDFDSFFDFPLKVWACRTCEVTEWCSVLLFVMEPYFKTFSVFFRIFGEPIVAWCERFWF